MMVVVFSVQHTAKHGAEHIRYLLNLLIHVKIGKCSCCDSFGGGGKIGDLTNLGVPILLRGWNQVFAKQVFIPRRIYWQCTYAEFHRDYLKYLREQTVFTHNPVFQKLHLHKQLVC